MENKYFRMGWLTYVHSIIMTCHLHCSLHNLSNILWLSFEFALAIHFFFCIQHSTSIYVTFKFSLSTFNFFIKQQSSFRIRSSSWVECTFIFHPTFSICPLSFCFPHPTLNIALASFRIRHSTFWIELLPAGQRPMEIVGSIDMTHPRSNGGRETSQWSGLGRPSPLPKNQTLTTDRTWPIARMTLHGLRERWVLSNWLSSLVERCISWKIS